MSWRPRYTGEQLGIVQAMLKEGKAATIDIMRAADVTREMVDYQRYKMGLSRPRAGQKRPVAEDTHPGYSVALCFVSGCYTRASSGKFCAAHDANAMAARATAGMSEATRRKLTGGRA